MLILARHARHCRRQSEKCEPTISLSPHSFLTAEAVADAELEAERGRETSARLWQAGECRGSERAMRRAVLVGRCSDPDNVWLAELEDKDGHRFPALGRKSACGSRLCPGCLKLLQRKSQTRLVAARDEFWEHNVREPGKFERFITLTGPTFQGMSLANTEQLYNRAFELLSDRAFWIGRVDAGAKHVEFTTNSRGYHTHIHCLIYGRYMERDRIEQKKSRAWRERRIDRAAKQNLRIVKDDLPPLGNLQDEWTACLTEAAREFGREIEWSAPELHDGWYSLLPDSFGEVVELQPAHAPAANVDVRFVREKGKPSADEIGLHSAVKELTKYIAKISALDAVSDEQLVEIAEVRRWPRCFELFGAWRRKRCAPVEAARPVLHLKAGETWESFCIRVMLANADPSSYVIAWDHLNSRQSLYAASHGVDAFLDTDFVNRSEITESPPQRLWLKPRAPSLMEIGEGMDLNSWLTLVSIRLMSVRRERRRQLARKYPCARFVCLDGSEFGNLRSQPSAETTMAAEVRTELRRAA